MSIKRAEIRLVVAILFTYTVKPVGCLRKFDTSHRHRRSRPHIYLILAQSCFYILTLQYLYDHPRAYIFITNDDKTPLFMGIIINVPMYKKKIKIIIIKTNTFYDYTLRT